MKKMNKTQLRAAGMCIQFDLSERPIIYKTLTRALKLSTEMISTFFSCLLSKNNQAIHVTNISHTWKMVSFNLVSFQLKILVRKLFFDKYKMITLTKT